MCWMCDHPDATVQEWLEAIRETVQKHGWAVQFVESDRTPHAYTFGLHECGLPELLVTGLPPQSATVLLNTVAGHLMNGGKLAPGDQISIVGGLEVEVIRVEHPDAHVKVAITFYCKSVQALQLVWADSLGLKPWSSAFANGRIRQPVFGVRVDVA